MRNRIIDEFAHHSPPFLLPFNSPCRKNSYTVYRQILRGIRHFADTDINAVWPKFAL